ncbi:DinB family protein [Gemmata sp. JC717]|uniref:DinB family protein n=1 Tax=Gemmata algarum TaxID=2975278 RepID=A0ABU5EVW7_9BACT|nr:DinB family protein [Gemmata algarum]MDY3552398.1 DinB family protein [Gemmata algarum]MDY3559443.1 DinB family protein [Gemmata algarum]
MSRLTDALEQIDFARRYTRERAVSVPPGDWFTVTPKSVSHVAWQVGHLASSEYRLCLARLRPRTAADESLIPDAFVAMFGREALPAAVTGYTAEHILAVFDAVHARVMEELPAYSDADLDLAPLAAHPLFGTRLGALRYAPLHEMIHCGQISLLRRMLGHAPIW